MSSLDSISQIVLGNGMRVITLEDFSSPVVDVQVWYHVGSKDERPDRQGFAHMFEHMMFRGTDRLGPTAHFDLIRRAGGWCNGSTGFDRTVYVETLPANQLELALWLEADRMAFLKIDQQSFDTERKVVEEERRLGLNGTYGSMYEKGMAVIVAKHRRISPDMLPPRVKSLNYLNNILARIESIDAGAGEALMLNADGFVAEATGEYTIPESKSDRISSRMRKDPNEYDRTVRVIRTSRPPKPWPKV
jgi:hypothetical protein